VREDTLLIVPCSKKKIWDRKQMAKSVPAKDAYVSPYFKLCRILAESISVPWLIFSAKYGLIQPDFVIPANYDVSFDKNSNKTADLSLITQQMKFYQVHNFKKVYSFCGSNYNKILRDAFVLFNKSIENPFPENMRSIGKRQKWIKYLCENPHLL